LKGRKDDKFSQKVRNLKSHNTFERLKYAKFSNDKKRNNIIEITDEGKKHLENNESILRYLLTNDFDYNDIKYSLNSIEKHQQKHSDIKIEDFDENILITEGVRKYISQNTNIYVRSLKLREYAINYFTEKGKLKCSCCSFDFYDFYGDIGKNFIEIHHIKPIFKYENEDITKTLENAVQNLVPLCSNCHRMIHKNRKTPLSISELNKNINPNLKEKFNSLFR
jgi:predicted HNH restriction endonuclease